jgi:hypothetical protein
VLTDGERSILKNIQEVYVKKSVREVVPRCVCRRLGRSTSPPGPCGRCTRPPVVIRILLDRDSVNINRVNII